MISHASRLHIIRAILVRIYLPHKMWIMYLYAPNAITCNIPRSANLDPGGVPEAHLNRRSSHIIIIIYYPFQARTQCEHRGVILILLYHIYCVTHDV